MKEMVTGVLLLALASSLYAQEDCRPLLNGASNRIYEDIDYLASDDLQGRKPGEEGARLAALYIEKEFRALGLEPVNEQADGFQQVFTIPDKVSFGDGNQLKHEGESYTLKSDFFPAKWSANSSASGQTVFVNYGITAPELEHNDYRKLKARKLKDKIFVMDIGTPDGIHPHSKYIKYHDLAERIELARDKGAKGVVLVNLTGKANDLSPDFKKIHSRQLPVIFVNDRELASRLKEKSSLSFTTEIKENRIITSNVVGLKNNGASTTIIIGAHYDHLGLGGEGSLFAKDKPAIHNGADDNASGVAGMLELAYNLSKADGNELSNYNYLFAAFSGEEMGLLGSAFMADNLEIEPRFMVNLDMIGRLEDMQLAVNGIGTSPQWIDLIREKGCSGLRIKASKSGVGPSDHTSFYHKEVPVLHFFTGTHRDYHKPSDDIEKLNIEGIVQVVSYIYELLHESAQMGNFQFTATTESTMEAPRFTVTLGVMPDYMYEGEGMRIDGVTEGRPASVAGLQEGDVILKMGDVKVVDMNSYMKALSRFEKGSKTQVTYQRGRETLTTDVQF